MFNFGKKKPNNLEVPKQKKRMNPEETLKMGTYDFDEETKKPAFMKTQRVPEITREECQLAKRAEGKVAYVLHNVFSEEECQSIIEWTEENLHWGPAMINIGLGRQVLNEEARKHDRAIVDSEEIADYIMERLKGNLNYIWDKRRLSCLNERLRFLRYEDGNYFAPHMDGQYRRPDGVERSYLTILFYLNDDFIGGRTNFLGYNEEYPATLKTGSILVFQHDILHEGALLESGQKYLMRTDVMYTSGTPKYERKIEIEPKVDPFLNQTGICLHYLENCFSLFCKCQHKKNIYFQRQGPWHIYFIYAIELL